MPFEIVIKYGIIIWILNHFLKFYDIFSSDYFEVMSLELLNSMFRKLSNSVCIPISHFVYLDPPPHLPKILSCSISTTNIWKLCLVENFVWRVDLTSAITLLYACKFDLSKWRDLKASEMEVFEISFDNIASCSLSFPYISRKTVEKLNSHLILIMSSCSIDNWSIYQQQAINCKLFNISSD